jgi:carboxyl-terminal processing protease
MQSLLLDLRDNGGGLVMQAYQIANTFLSSGQTVFSQRGRVEGAYGSFEARNNNPDKTPIVLLVNRNSASASEILAGALQDHDRALIVGETTFGKGLVQNPFQNEDGSMLLLTIAKYYTPSGRSIQRDYSNGNLYDYYSKGGSLSDDAKPQVPAAAEQRKTDSGRIVYGGVGIVPDETVKTPTLTSARYNQQVKLIDPIFAYALDLAFGKVAGLESYRIDRPIVYGYDLKETDFKISEPAFQAFKKVAVDKYGLTTAQIDREREFVERALRSQLVTAAYGTTTPLRILNENDNQLKKAIEALPRAKQLALDAERINTQKIGAQLNR